MSPHPSWAQLASRWKWWSCSYLPDKPDISQQITNHLTLKQYDLWQHPKVSLDLRILPVINQHSLTGTLVLQSFSHVFLLPLLLPCCHVAHENLILHVLTPSSSIPRPPHSVSTTLNIQLGLLQARRHKVSSEAKMLKKIKVNDFSQHKSPFQNFQNWLTVFLLNWWRH